MSLGNEQYGGFEQMSADFVTGGLNVIFPLVLPTAGHVGPPPAGVAATSQ